MGAKGKPSSNAERIAGAKNLKKYTDQHGHGAAIKHGAYSKEIRQKYADPTKPEGRRLEAAVATVIEDLGGSDSLNGAQQLLLANLRAKLIIIFQISDYLAKQVSIFAPDGELIGSLRRSFLPYTSSIRDDLRILYALNMKQKSKVPSLMDVINQKDGGK